MSLPCPPVLQGWAKFPSLGVTALLQFGLITLHNHGERAEPNFSEWCCDPRARPSSMGQRLPLQDELALQPLCFPLQSLPSALAGNPPRTLPRKPLVGHNPLFGKHFFIKITKKSHGQTEKSYIHDVFTTATNLQPYSYQLYN